MLEIQDEAGHGLYEQGLPPEKYGLPSGTKREIGVPLHGETSCIKVDGEMKTNLEGLWAIGDTSYAGSAVAGAVASPPGVTPGSGIMYAVISAGWGVPSAARYAAGAAPAEVNAAEAKREDGPAQGLRVSLALS